MRLKSTIDYAHHLDWKRVALDQEPLLAKLVVIDPLLEGLVKRHDVTHYSYLDDYSAIEESQQLRLLGKSF
jgi:hypothetical protein